MDMSPIKNLYWTSFHHLGYNLWLFQQIVLWNCLKIGLYLKIMKVELDMSDDGINLLYARNTVEMLLDQ